MTTVPQLRIEGPSELAAIRTRLESADPSRLSGIATMVGLNDVDAGPPIHILLASENSEVARAMSPWIAGFAADDSIVIFPDRSPRYPNDTLEDVLRHEVAHVLIGRAAGGRPIPRWFNEGLAMAAERDRGFADQTQLLIELVSGPRTNINELNRLFAGGQSDQTRAYAIAGALVHDILKRSGSNTAATILSRVRRGESFDDAFLAVTRSTPSSADSDFWERQRLWTNWAPILTSTTALWTIVTLLALLAIYRRRRRDVEIEKRWEEEDGDQ